MKGLRQMFKKRLLLVLISIFTICSTGLVLTACDVPFLDVHICEYQAEVINATCTEDGYTVYTCDCGETYTDDVVLALGHSFTTYQSNNNATPYKNATETAICDRADCLEVDTREIPNSKLPLPEGEMETFEIHFMTLGNYKAGDCTYIKAGENDILIDAGSDYDSIDDICDYLDGYVLDGTLEYVIVTHADMDHIASFAGERNIFSEYECEIIIDFPLSNKTTKVYENYQENRNNEVLEGAKHFTALECYNESKDGAQRVYQLGEIITLQILNNYYYSNEDSDENNYSVCVNFTHGDRNFLFTGDLEKEGEEYLVALNDLPEVDFYKAGHHGSKTSSTDVLLNEIKPKLCVVSCVAGTDQYTDIVDNQFPTQDFIDRISKWTDQVYVPAVDNTDSDDRKIFEMLNGDITIYSRKDGIEVVCSENNTLLKDTEWFSEYRDCPTDWLD